MERLQCVETYTVGYVKGRCAKVRNVIDLNWLPTEENIYYIMNNPELPTYLPLVTVERRKNLRSNESGSQLRNGDKGSMVSITYQRRFENVQAKRNSGENRLSRSITGKNNVKMYNVVIYFMHEENELFVVGTSLQIFVINNKFSASSPSEQHQILYRLCFNSPSHTIFLSFCF